MLKKHTKARQKNKIQKIKKNTKTEKIRKITWRNCFYKNVQLMSKMEREMTNGTIE